MKYRSFSTVNTDAYRAGHEIGVDLNPLHPEVVLVFMSFNYADEYGALHEGLLDGLGEGNPLVFGCTGDGIYETENVQHHGVCALGMNSGGAVKWTALMVPGVGADSYAAAKKCAEEALAKLGGKASFAFVLADGIQSDGSRLVAGFQSVLEIPFMGGLAGDNRKFGQTFVMLNEKAAEDVAAILLGDGDVRSCINAASGWTPVGASGVVDVCHGNVIERISGIPAYAFMKEQLGKSPSETDVGIIPLATTQKGDHGGCPALRSVLHFNTMTGSATMIGSIEMGSVVRVCTATHQEVISGVDEAFLGLRDAPFEPQAALVVSCAGRKWVMGDRGQQEVEKIFTALGRRLPMIGFPSFGEIAPFLHPDGHYTPSYFHNVTIGICLLGE